MTEPSRGKPVPSVPPGSSGTQAGSSSPEAPSEKVADLVKQSAIYGIGALATQLAGFFLLPILARVLSPAQYGIVFLAEMLGLLMFVISELGLASAFFRFYVDEKEETGQRRLIYSIFNALALIALGSTVIYLLFSDGLSRLIFGSPGWRGAFVLVCITNLLTILSRMPLDLLRIARRAGVFVLISCVRLAVTFFVTMYLVVYAHRGVMGALEGTLVGTAVGFAFLAPTVFHYWKPTMDLSVVKRALRFGVFLVPAGLAAWAINQSDRYLLRAFGDLTMVGIYGVGFKFASVVNVFLVAPFLTAWTPFMFRVSTQDNAKELYSRVLTYFALVSMFILVILSATISDITRLVAGVSYTGAAPVVPLVALGFVLYGVASIVVVGVYLREKTYHTSIAMLLGALVKIVLSVVTISRFGVIGVAFATVAAFATVVGYFLAVLSRLFPVHYELRRMLTVVLAGLVSYLVLGLIPLSGLGAIAVRLVSSLVFPFLLWASGFPTAAEKERVFGALRRVLRR